MKEFTAYFESPIGLLRIVGTEEGISCLDFVEEPPTVQTAAESSGHSSELPAVVVECRKQLQEYFAGTRKSFTIPCLLKGTPFQQQVWKALMQIPYGNTVSYQYIASAIGNEKAVRAVGNTNRNNEISIIIPCHRVIGKDGKLTGYAGGLWRKEWLLAHEKKC